MASHMLFWHKKIAKKVWTKLVMLYVQLADCKYEYMQGWQKKPTFPLVMVSE